MTPWPPCIVLAGGLGTRLRSVVSDLPKCLAPVGDRPFLEIQMSALMAAGLNDMILSLGYRADDVVAALRSSPRAWPVRYFVEDSPQGTGGAIAQVMDKFELDEVLVVNGDTHLDGDIAGMRVPLERGRGEQLRMAVTHVEDRSRFGGVRVDVDGRVRGFLEKGQQGTGVINAGLYRLSRNALPKWHPEPYSLEAHVLPGLVKRGAVRALEVGGNFTDIGIPADYAKFCMKYAS